MVVADEITFDPQPFTRRTSSAAGKPKWKLTTGGLKASSTAAVSSSNRVRPACAGIAAGSTPSSR